MAAFIQAVKFGAPAVIFMFERCGIEQKNLALIQNDGRFSRADDTTFRTEVGASHEQMHLA